MAPPRQIPQWPDHVYRSPIGSQCSRLPFPLLPFPCHRARVVVGSNLACQLKLVSTAWRRILPRQPTDRPRIWRRVPAGVHLRRAVRPDRDGCRIGDSKAEQVVGKQRQSEQMRPPPGLYRAREGEETTGFELRMFNKGQDSWGMWVTLKSAVRNH